MFFQLGKGYIDLYKSGIIHEDIKPSNILIKGKLFKYCDFGIS
jgi:serine/threonine protein kinase